MKMQGNNPSNSQPLVSVLLITFNQEEFIEESLHSAIAQDYQNLEVVVADDASTDGTPAIIRRYAAEYPKRIIPLLGNKNLGITGNSNRALALCRGDYIALLGGDDVFLPGKISLQVEWMLQDQRRALCYHDLDVFDSTSGRTLYRWFERFLPRNGGCQEVIKGHIGACSVMFKRPAIRPNAFDNRIPISSDWLFNFETVARQDGRVGALSKVLARYRRHAGNVTNTRGYYFRDAHCTLDIITRDYGRLGWWLASRRSDLYFIESFHFLRSGHPLKALCCMAQSISAANGLWCSPLRLAGHKLLGIRI